MHRGQISILQKDREQKGGQAGGVQEVTKRLRAINVARNLDPKKDRAEGKKGRGGGRGTQSL